MEWGGVGRFGTLGGHDHEGGFAAVGGIQSATALADVPIDRVTGNAQPATNLLGPHMLGYEAQTLPLTRGQPRDSAFQGGVRLVHGEGYGSIIGRTSIRRTHLAAWGAEAYGRVGFL